MRKRHPHRSRLVAIAVPLGLCLASQDGTAAPALQDYKYFRALSTDLLGRIPTRQELAAFEQPGFDINRWIDTQLQGPAYGDRMTRIYSDLLRPELNNQFRYTSTRNFLATLTYMAPSGKLTRLFWRPGQMRPRTAQVKAMLAADPNYKVCSTFKPTDAGYAINSCQQYEQYDNIVKAGMCVTATEIGVRYDGSTLAPIPYPPGAKDVNGTAPHIPAVQAALDANTTTTRPWWLYADYRSASPTDLYNASAWATRFPGYVLTSTATLEPDNLTPVTDIRICNEEVATPLTAVADNTAIKNQVSCISGYGVSQSSQCGCGPGLEWCMPGLANTTTFPATAFNSSRNVFLGVGDPADATGFTAFDWQSLWLTQEPIVYLNHVFNEDRDVRTLVTGRDTYVNGPLAQFYKFSARSYWTDPSAGATPLPDPASLPSTLMPFDTQTWVHVADRGPNAAGVLTEPWFLWKFATRRSRAHVMYNAFLCRDLVAPQGLQLPISTQPNLMIRQGCDACHQTLEPLAAYFARFVESDWSWLDPAFYPVQNPTCKESLQSGLIPSSCTGRYDNVFSTANYGALYGSYANPMNTDGGPAALGQFLVAKPDYANCVAQNVAQDFLGRTMTTEDGDMLSAMVSALTANGYRARPMVKVLVQSNAYRSANNLNSTVWRQGGNP